MSNKRLRLTVEVAVNEETLQEKGLQVEDVICGLRIRESDVIDGFEITTDIPGCDCVNDFFLVGGDIVEIEPIDEAKDKVTDKYVIAKEVELEDFKNALECLDYNPDDYSEEELLVMLSDLEGKLAESDTYNGIYNEALCEVVEEHEKVRSVNDLIADATQTCEEVNKGAKNKSEIEFDKE